ncbi:MAG: Cna B domain protein [Candidatus Daviesbacteria bacterium GW2011_GWF2_38_7]|nr:MAG: Cna B domain protein [Candidatus Daviesbacteria bacterium GW2011_GWF2_38_7]
MKLTNQKGLAPIFIVLFITVISSAVLFLEKPPVISQTSLSPAVIVIPTPTPSETPSPSPVPTPSPSPIPTPIPKPTPSPIPTVVASAPGYTRQTVNAEGQNYKVDIIAADLNTTKVIVDTASESDCSNNCPVMPLGDYVGRNGAYAGINGSFFCPPEYSSCSGKTNSFDTLVMNKNKRYFNSDNNVYSNIPAAIFSQGSARFVGRSLEWGRDTSPDSVIANYPLLITGGNINFTENPSEPKFGQKGPRTFIGVIYGATMGESAKVLKALDMGDALNLDEGGSTALWHGGYKVGPGRNIPNAVLFVNR